MKAPNKKNYKQFLKDIKEKRKISEVIQSTYKQRQERLDQEFMIKYEEKRVTFMREMGYSEEKIQEELRKIYSRFNKD